MYKGLIKFSKSENNYVTTHTYDIKVNTNNQYTVSHRTHIIMDGWKKHVELMASRDTPPPLQGGSAPYQGQRKSGPEGKANFLSPP